MPKVEIEFPAPRPAEVNTIMAPKYVPLIEDNLQAGKGSIPGKTKSEEVEIIDDGLIAGLGCVPG
ncbi:MAG: hypothetical protein KKD44_27510 [Proteobacteria bacterium]|nr:hypothetical protein [Pseudomonadota bacterium]